MSKSDEKQQTSSVPLNKIVSWIKRESDARIRLKERALESNNVQQYQFESGYLRAIQDISEQIIYNS